MHVPRQRVGRTYSSSLIGKTMLIYCSDLPLSRLLSRSRYVSAVSFLSSGEMGPASARESIISRRKAKKTHPPTVGVLEGGVFFIFIFR